MKKKGRNPNRAGSVKHRSDGRWEARVPLPGGGDKYYYGRTRAEADKKRIAALHELDRGGQLIRDERLRVGRYLEEWLKGKEASLRPRTFLRYRSLLAHVTREIGDQRLSQVTAARLERLYRDLQAAGMSETTAHHVHTVLRQAFADAERLEYIPRNVADRVKAPRLRHVERAFLNLEQAQAFLTAVGDARLGALYILAISTGMRQGEILALRWRDVDLRAGALEVRGTLYRLPHEGFFIGSPKTERSHRQVDLAASVVEALKAHRKRQVAEKLASGLGEAWGDPRWPDLVFTTPSGRPIDGQSLVRHDFYPLLKRADLPKIRFHDLRHTFAALARAHHANGLDISAMLGHSNPAVTDDWYGHSLPGATRAVADAVDEALHRDLGGGASAADQEAK